MKIESSNVQMAAVSMQKTSYQKTEQLKVWKDSGKELGSNAASNPNGLSLDEFIKKMKENLVTYEGALAATVKTSDEATEEYEIPTADEDKIRLLNKLIEAMTGKKMKFFSPKRLHIRQLQNPGTYTPPVAVANQSGEVAARKGWGIDYQKHEYTEEKAHMSFSSGGKVITSDGREITFQVDLNLSRSFTSESHVSFKAGDALVDPLVINFQQSSAELTNEKFSFDLNNDGQSENISFAKSGSGFLVFDRNNDGIVNNGSELFGPGTGNGFLELAALDSDGNNWIDENDDIYDKLQIWTKDASGQDQLLAIGEKGIGAIYLGSVQSSFALKDSSNTTLGQIQRTGIFLKEDGTAGTIQHVDISI